MPTKQAELLTTDYMEDRTFTSKGDDLCINNYVFLTLAMAMADFKVKYDNSVLGYLWSLLKPLLMFGTLYIVFTIFVRWDVKNYNLYLLLGIILWNFLAEVTLNSMVLLEAKSQIIRKIYFPRWIIVIASSLTSLLTLLVNICVFFLFVAFSGIAVKISALLLVVGLFELYLFSVGLALLLCALYPRFRDIHHIWEVFVQLGFWATPIIYPIAIVPKKYHSLIFINPVARIIQGSREALIGPSGQFTTISSHLLVIGIGIFVFIAGLKAFNKLSVSFAEDL